MNLTGPNDAKLYLESDSLEVESHRLAGGDVAVFSARAPDREGPNQDAAALIPFDERAAVLVVADGVGGAPGGQQASRIAVEALWTALGHAPRDGSALRSAILDAVEAANAAVVALGGGAATTLAVVEIQGSSARPYHVGDSTILGIGQRGRLKLQTVAHSPVGFAVEAGVLDEVEAMHHEDRHLVSNVLGAADMRIEVGSTLALAPRDTLLLASDGLFDNLHIDEIVEHVRAGPLDRGLGRLAEAARARMERPQQGQPSKPDDLTLVAFRRAH